VKLLFALIIAGTVLAGCGGSPAPETPTTPQAVPTPAAKPPDESGALDMIRKINEAQAAYHKMNRRYALAYDELMDARLLDGPPSTAETGYKFELRPAPNAESYRLSVVPADSNSVSAKHFFTDQTGTVHAETGKDATADSPPVS
jgi:hypothetical protein